MNAQLKKSFTIAASAVIAALSIGSAAAQNKVKADKPMFDDLQSPEFSGGKQKGFRPKNWLEIETQLKVSMKPEPKTKTCDKLTIKWYVAVKNTEKSASILLFTKDVEYVNVPLDEEMWFSVYLSPASIKRLTGSDRAAKSAVEAVGYEVYINGEKLAEETTKWKPQWWNADPAQKASLEISRSDVVPLLIKAQTPFSNMWWDRYAEVNEATSAR
jgi:hypothetical protein